jgi:SagB-type dehydrogenase family enzyme
MRLNGNLKITSRVLFAGCSLAILLAVAMPAFCETPRRLRPGEQKVIQLPEPNRTSPVSLEAAINTRRSTRQFADSAKSPLNYAQIGQLAWAGQGITNKQQGLRAAPSAGALYPIELYFVTPEGIFIYNPEGHLLKQISSIDMRKQLSVAADGQGPVEDAACDIVIAGSARKIAPKYGNKAQKFMFLEAGHVAQNIQLQAVSLGLASLPVGSFEIRNVAKVCELTGELEPLLIVCVGHPFVQQKPQDQSQSIVKLTKKALLVVPPAQFTDAELFDTQRILTEAGVTSVVASSKIGALQGVFGGIAASEITIERVRVEDYDAIIFIGGPGAAEYFSNPLTLRIAREASAMNKVIAAISSAPMILANAGVLRGIRATGLPQQGEQMKKAGAQFTGSAVERDGLIITANESLVAVQFARDIVAVLRGNQPKPDKAPMQ